MNLTAKLHLRVIICLGNKSLMSLCNPVLDDNHSAQNQGFWRGALSALRQTPWPQPHPRLGEGSLLKARPAGRREGQELPGHQQALLNSGALTQKTRDHNSKAKEINLMLPFLKWNCYRSMLHFLNWRILLKRGKRTNILKDPEVKNYNACHLGTNVSTHTINYSNTP